MTLSALQRCAVGFPPFTKVPTADGRARRRSRMTVRSIEGNQVDRGFGLLEWSSKLVPQGLLVKGAKSAWKLAWQTMMRELAPQSKDGAYTRPAYTFTGEIGRDFPVESGRYVVYLGNACPWCHRVLLALVVRGLLEHVQVAWAVDDPERASRGGWVFDAPDPVFGLRDLREVYDAASPGFRGRCTAPLLVDRKSKRAVNNESADLVRMLNAVQLPGCSAVDLRPATLAPAIDALNDAIYHKVNNGVYKSGFATTQGAYDAAQRDLYETLDMLEERLSCTRFLLGERFTEADLRLFPTLVRYDAAYAVLFKCSRRRIADYPNLSAWLRDVYQLEPGAPGAMQVRDTIDLEAARRSYFTSLFPLNPGGIVPSGPTLGDLHLDAPAGRGPRDAATVFHMQGIPVLQPAATH